MRAAMQIRSLLWKDISMWPPEWWISDCEAGEDGVLAEVQFLHHLTPACLYVAANHLGDIRKGIIVLESPAHLEVLYRKLLENIGRPLREIGDLEIELFPPLPKLGQKQARPKNKSRTGKRMSK
jgi:hypothetical protein